MASGDRSWNTSASLTALLLPVATIQNDLNQGWPGSLSANSKAQATRSLDGEKSRLLAEAAVELREENTRQERILDLAKRLAVLQGRDPDRGRTGGAAPTPGPSSGGLYAQGPVELCPEPQGKYWSKAVAEGKVAAIEGQGTPVPSGAEPSVPDPKPCQVELGVGGPIRMVAETAQLWTKCHWEPNQLRGARV